MACDCLDQQQAHSKKLVLIAGFIHDVRHFIDEHPGGAKYLETHIGKDATAAFFGGVYDHSNAAHNVSTSLGFLLTPYGSEAHIDSRTMRNTVTCDAACRRTPRRARTH